jgi:hypothetical protein
MKLTERDVDWQYVITENEEENLRIKILTGDFIDTVYFYKSASIKEESDGNAYLSFIFEVIESPLDKDALSSNVEFRNHIGNILTAIIDEKVNKNEIRADDSEESDL